MSFWLSVGILFTILTSLILLIIAVVMWFHRDEDEVSDRPFAINFLSQYVDGIAYGVEKDVIIGKGGRKIITLEQRDLHPTKVKEMKDVKVIVDKNKILTLPKGTWSKNRNINIYLPASVSDIPEALKNTELGKMIALLTELKNAENTEIETLKIAIDRQTKFIKDYGGGEASRKLMSMYNDMLKDLVNAVRKSKGDEGRFQPPTFGTDIPPSI